MSRSIDRHMLELGLRDFGVAELEAVYRLIAWLCLCSAIAPVLAENLRCGRDIVSKGDSTLLLRQRCGEPTGSVHSRHPWSLLRQRCGEPTQVERHEDRSAFQRYDRLTDSYITERLAHPYEVWTYNFGPRRLVTRVTIRGGVVKSIVTDGYGF